MTLEATARHFFRELCDFSREFPDECEDWDADSYEIERIRRYSESAHALSRIKSACEDILNKASQLRAWEERKKHNQEVTEFLKVLAAAKNKA